MPTDPATGYPKAGLSRREVLRLGALGLGGWTLPELARLQQAQATAGQPVKPARAKRCLILAMIGGPPHQDTFDLKPQAPAEIRGEFKPIATNVPGIQVCDHLPRLARHADKYAIVRSVHTDNHNHSTSEYAMFSGFLVPTTGENNSTPEPNDNPAFGSVLWKLRGKAGPVPPYVLLCGIPDYNGGPYRGELAGRLGKQYNPITVAKQDYAAPTFKVSDLELIDEVSPARLQGRHDLLQGLEGSLSAALAVAGSKSGWDANRRNGFDLLGSRRIRSAFDLEAEPPRVRDRYGRHTFGQSVLLARRLLEQEVGVSCVTVHWGTSANPGANRYLPIWDTHYGNCPALKELLLPTTDQAFSALLEDLDERGLLDETLIVWMGDFGRTPKINERGGRDHWGSCFTVVLAGGGIRGGQVYGASDQIAAYPKENPVTHGDIHATIYHALGIDSQTVTVTDALGRELPLHDKGKPLEKLF